MASVSTPVGGLAGRPDNPLLQSLTKFIKSVCIVFVLSPSNAVKTTPKLFLSCLFCIVLLLSAVVAMGDDRRISGARTVLSIKGVEYAFRWCPPGMFMMGSPASELGRIGNETQYHVVLSHGFWMLETPVTQSMWENVTGSNPSGFRGANLPVECVSWDDCQEFIQKLNGLNVAPTGYRFSLPTEAQWEYACRAGTTTPFHFGSTLDIDKANFSGSVGPPNEPGRTSAVGSYPANAWGLHDMHGNVREWCLDWYGNYPSGSVTDPTVPFGSVRVIRGGCWSRNSHATECRSASRSAYGQSERVSFIGFRLALVPAE